jgi:CspA family cold shock protein
MCFRVGFCGEGGKVPSDAIVRCAECSTTFVWTVSEQAAGSRPSICPACRHLAPAPGRSRGLVKWFSHAKGYGFITPVEGPELFVHKAGLDPNHPSLRAGELVEFTRVATQRGVQAEQVVVLGSG